jgi:hypothetical protein
VPFLATRIVLDTLGVSCILDAGKSGRGHFMAVVVVDGRLTKLGESSVKNDIKTYKYILFETADDTEISVRKADVDLQVDALVDVGMSGRFVFTRYPMHGSILQGLQTADGRCVINPFARSRRKYYLTIFGGLGFVGFVLVLMCMTPFIVIGLPMLLLLLYGVYQTLKDANGLFEELEAFVPSKKTVEL